MVCLLCAKFSSARHNGNQDDLGGSHILMELIVKQWSVRPGSKLILCVEQRITQGPGGFCKVRVRRIPNGLPCSPFRCYFLNSGHRAHQPKSRRGWRGHSTALPPVQLGELWRAVLWGAIHLQCSYSNPTIASALPLICPQFAGFLKNSLPSVGPSMVL